MDTLKKCWEWLKANWKWVLFPVGILLFLAGRLTKPAEVVVVNPDGEATKREREEAARVNAELTVERDALRKRLEEVRRENQEKLVQLTEQQRTHAARLEGDPEALNAWLRSL
jgi:uncharacterized membrane protein